MTSPPRTTDAPPANANTSPRKDSTRHSKKIRTPLLLAGIFLVLVVAHLPLLDTAYHDDEAAHLVPAARDIFSTGDLAPTQTTERAHPPPLVTAYLALAWKLAGFRVTVARASMLLIAALALAGLFRLSERAANREVAWATVVCTALYPVFFAQSSLVQLDTAAAAFTVWGLVLYLPAKRAAADESVADFDFEGQASLSRRLACVALFASAALAKETAVVAAVALAGWEILGGLIGRFRPETARSLCVDTRRPSRHTLLWLAAPLPLLLWLLYQRGRTGHFLGGAEYFRHDVEWAMNLGPVFGRLWEHLRHLTAHMNLWALTIPTVVAMFMRALEDEGVARRRIDARVQLVFAVVVVAYVAALSVVGAEAARNVLPVVPLVILICVSTLRRRVRRWRLLIVAVCAAFVAGLLWK